MPLIVHNTQSRTFNPGDERYHQSLPAHNDEKHSAVVSGNCSESFLNEQRIPLVNKSTADKVVVGYSSEGLPFQIIVNGSNPTDGTNRFIEEHVVPLMEHYIRELKKAPHKTTVTDFNHNSPPNHVTKKIIRELYALKQEHAEDAEFSMSIAVNYAIGEETFCSGFGIGDTSLIVKRTNGTIEQLVSPTSVREEQEAASSIDTFGKNPSSQKINAIIARNPIFSTTCEQEDELVGYTFAYFSQQKSAQKKQLKNGTVTYSYPLNTELLNRDKSLFDAITSLSKDKHQAIIDSASNKAENSGDDVSFAGTRVPSAQFRVCLREKQYHHLHDLVTDAVKDLKDGTKFKEKALAVLDTLAPDKKNFSLAAKNEALSETYYLLTTANKAASYRKFANEVQGRPSRACKILGGLMLALAVAAAATVITLVSISTLGVGTFPAIALMAIGGASLLSSIGLFGYGRRFGLSKAMVGLADGVEADESNGLSQ